MVKPIWSGLAGLALGLVGTVGNAHDAAAECLRRIYNRSSLVLVVRQDGGPPVSLLPGRSLPVRLTRPGRFELSAACGALSPGEAPAAQARFAYEAVLDRCFVRFGSDLYGPQLGRGFFGTQETAPFTLNNPQPGDVVLGPVAAPACPVLSRRG